MDVEIVEKDSMKMLGMDYYGPAGEERENPAEILWEMFSDFTQKNWNLLEHEVKGKDLSYEVHIWNEEEIETIGVFHIFVGIEVKSLEGMPLELVSKVLPGGEFARFTFEGKEIVKWESTVLEKWLPDSGYDIRPHKRHLYHIQCFDEKLFKGIDMIEESTLTVYLPIMPID